MQNSTPATIRFRIVVEYLKVARLLAISFLSLAYAVISRLPGMRFDLCGRKLALKGFLARSPGQNFRLLLNPVSCIRYFEFDFVRRHLGESGKGKMLDVSSPRLLSLWAGDADRFQVTMVNLDVSDLVETRRLCDLEGAQIQLDVATALHLPYPDNNFDVLISISVIEHINGVGDGQALDEFIRVVRPGGRIILTCPVAGAYYEEYRSSDPYGTQETDAESGLYFFQRFYDEESINLRLLNNNRQVQVVKKEYFLEHPSGWFEKYIQSQLQKGLSITVKDPWLMCKHFGGPSATHPSDRMGNCHLVLEVIK